MADDLINKLDKEQCEADVKWYMEWRKDLHAYEWGKIQELVAKCGPERMEFALDNLAAMRVGVRQRHKVERAELNSMMAQLTAQGDTSPVLASIGETEEEMP